MHEYVLPVLETRVRTPVKGEIKIEVTRESEISYGHLLCTQECESITLTPVILVHCSGHTEEVSRLDIAGHSIDYE